jgi:broad specificity phosphatase PhoE/ribonuclease HI
VTRRLVVEADGGSRGNPGPAGYGAVVRDEASGSLLAERAGFLGTTTNNVAEYNGLIAGLEAARALDETAEIAVRMDSKLVVEQMSGRWQIKHPDMKPLALRARELTRGATVTFTWIPREANKAADALANEAMDSRLPVIARDHVADGPLVGPEYDDAVEPDVINAESGAEPGAAGTTSPRAPRNARALEPEYLAPLTIVFVRHGVTDLTVTHRLSGSGVPGPGLSAAGKVQAAKAADALYRIGRDTWERVPKVTRVIASPMVRTQETAQAIGRRLGLVVATDERLREVDFGTWEGLTAEEAIDRDGDAILRWQDAEVRPPHGESIADVAARGKSLLVSLAAEHAQTPGAMDTPQTIVAVSHAVAIKATVGAAMGFPLERASRVWPVPASLSIVQMRVLPSGEIGDAHLLCLGAPVE